MTTEEEDKEFARKLGMLKNDWSELKPEHESTEEMQRIVHASRLSRLTRHTTKENVMFAGKVLGAVAAIMVFDFFMGSKPITTAWIIFLLLDDYIGYRYLHFLPVRDSVRETLQMSLIALKRLRYIYVLIPVAIWTVLTLILPMLPNGERAAVTSLALLPVLFLVCLWVWIKWSVRIREVAERLRTFNELSD